MWLEGWEEEEDTKEKKVEKEEEEEEVNEDDMYQFFQAVRKEELALSKGFNCSRKALGGNKKLYEQMAAQKK